MQRGFPLSRSARWLRAAAILTSVTLISLAGAEPVVHEYIDLGPGQGLVEPAVTGERPPERAASPGDANGGSSAVNGAGAQGTPAGAPFSIDADTTRPERVEYSDPFTPTVVPFKRGVAYDSVNREGDLVVRDDRLEAVETRQRPGENDEHFRASLELDVTAGARVAIPSVAPGARLVVAHAEPPRELRIGVDSAENWYVESSMTSHVRLTLQLVADRRVFGSVFRDASWSELGRELPPLPENVKSAALGVARTLGVADALRPRDAVAALVEHFRRFLPSTKRPSSSGLLLYRDLALTARGICRHRAYAFMVTALGLGIPTRYVMNEAHAWVEVFDGELWHRIDLGGAAEQLSMDETGRPRHVEPRDPFAWPDPTESGNALASRANEPGAPPPSDAPAGAPPSDGPAASPDPPPPPAGANEPSPSDEPAGAEPDSPDAPSSRPDAPALPSEPPPAPPARGPDPNVRLDTGAKNAERGKTLYVSGLVRRTNRPCHGASVDVRLVTGDGALPLGALVTNAQGEFSGRLVIPWNAPLGSHQLEASASGECKSN
jgi:hypothetical protein